MKKLPIPIESIPTPAWIAAVIDNIQVITGRRKNSIFVVPQPALTFSATPTKAECEALFAYTNQVRTALAAVVMRLDQ